MTRSQAIDPPSLLRPRRKIRGMSAILLPFDDQQRVSWPCFRTHLERTAAAGLTPAVNMDTGYANLIDEATRQQVLDETRRLLQGGPFVAGAFVGDQPGADFQLDAYRRQLDLIQQAGGLPILFQSHGLTALNDADLVEAYRQLGRDCPRYLAFELSQAFAPFGKIYALETYRGLLGVSSCIGAKHSSLSRVLEWERLRVRDDTRPDFLVLTGNDLAIDMVMYGSDYLLGLSTLAPDWFAVRDRLWEAGDPAFYEANDLLQYLGCFAFRRPVPAYKHSAAQFLALRRWIRWDAPHPQAARRPDSDRAVLAELLERMEEFFGRISGAVERQ